VRSPNEVVLAVDSMATPAKLETKGSIVLCKVFACGDFYVAFAGAASRPNSVFDLSKLVVQPCQMSIDARTKFDAIQKAILPRYTKLLEVLRSEDSVSYGMSARTGELSLFVVMIGVENGTPFIMKSFYPQPANTDGPLVVNPVPEFLTDPLRPGEGWQYNFAGYYNEIQELLKTRNPFAEFGTVKGSEFLVNYMIRAQPQHVGPPIDIVRITKNESEWICQKPGCDKQGRGKPCSEMAVPSPEPRVPAQHGIGPAERSTAFISPAYVLGFLIVLGLSALFLLRRYR
jgi:hypothetical protein